MAKAAVANSEEHSSNALHLSGPSPFGETANPAEYVPRDDTEAVLGELASLVSRGCPAALTAAPGSGKTLLLHVLARRLGEGLRCLYLPYGAMALEELCAWALGRLEEPRSGEPAEALFNYVRAAQRDGTFSALVLMIDDASSLPHGTARALGRYVQASRRALRLVLAASDDAASSRTLAAVGPEVVEVRLSASMSRRETHLYVRSRLAKAGVPEAMCAPFDTAALDRIHSLAAGVPRRVNEAAASLVSALPAGVHAGWRDQCWLGAPLDELSVGGSAAGELEGSDLREMAELLLDDEMK